SVVRDARTTRVTLPVAGEIQPLKVVIGIPDVMADLERINRSAMGFDLARQGCDVTLLATGTSGKRIEGGANFRVHNLQSRIDDGWTDYWLELIRFLEESGPCLYLSSANDRAGWIYPRLSDRVMVVPVLYEDDKASYDHCRLLGRYCNALIARDPDLRQRILADFPDLAARLVRIREDSVGRDLVAIAQTLSSNVARGRFRRRRGRVIVPAEYLDSMGGSAKVWPSTSVVSRSTLWPNPDTSRVAPPIMRASRRSRTLSDYRIVVGVTSGRISGVDIFSGTLVRALRARGYRAQILRTRAPERTPDPLPLAEDLEVEDLGLPSNTSWSKRWSSLKAYLESEPTIYIPNYDEKHSAVAPALNNNVRVVGIAHSDDPLHYQHIVRLSRYWDAVVGVSTVIARVLNDIAPSLGSRLSVIPYGVDVPPEPVGQRRAAGSPLLAIYTGRLVQYQKRALDLARIGDGIRAAGINAELTVVGNGPDADRLVQKAAPSLVARTMRWVGSVPNDELIGMLRESHAFILPSSFEGLPVSVLEAMANGCVPIVTAVRSGVPELIRDGENGFVVPLGDIDAIVSRLKTLETNDACRASMAVAAWQTVREGYTSDRMASAYISTLEQMLERDYERPRGKVIRPPSLRGLRARLVGLPPFMINAFWRVIAMLG
ncbi:MAG: glycosyltransferase family 4 protein, partial [Thermoanaerobaculia bacterium]